MRIVIQRVKEASVTINNELISKVQRGLLILIGIEDLDTEEDINWLTQKVVNLGADVYIATVDGSVGTKGFVTNAIKENNIEADYFYACGPLSMLRALYEKLTLDGEMSFEERMGCGFGICMGCSCKTKQGHKRICKEGPVLKKDEIIW